MVNCLMECLKINVNETEGHTIKCSSWEWELITHKKNLFNGVD